MWRALRIAMMCFLTAAIPVQGFAAATVHRCASNHHHGATAEPFVHADGGAQHHAGHHHPTDATASDAHEDGVQTSSKGSCSVCASCCTAAALPAAILSFDALVFVESLATATAGSVAAFLTDGPERPPRSLLA